MIKKSALFFASAFMSANLLTSNNVFAQDDPLKKGFALIIGQSQYQDQRWDAVEDISLQTKALRDELKYHFEEVILLENLKGNELKEKLLSFIIDKGKIDHSRIMIYFAGHGYTETRIETNEFIGYITGVDTPLITMTKSSLDAGRDTSVSMPEIKGALERSRAQSILVIFDSCFAGSFFQSRSPNDLPPILNKDTLEDLISRPSRRIIAAGRKDQKTPARSPVSDLLIRALHGDGDQAHMGFVSSADIGIYLRNDLLKRTDIHLSPQIGSLPGMFEDGEFLFRVNNKKISNNVTLVPQYEKAAEGGDITAKLNLGDILANSHSEDHNIEKATKLYREASDQKNATGQYITGIYYRDGIYYQRNTKIAAKYFKLASDQGLAPAQAALGQFYEGGSGGIPRDSAKAAELYLKAANQGDMDGEVNIARFYYNGLGYVGQDYEKAISYYKSAAAKGSLPAQAMLGYAYLNGRGGLPANKNMAVQYFMRTANRGDDIGQVNLGAAYECGWGGLPKDFNNAIYWYSKASAQGVRLATKRLAILQSYSYSDNFCQRSRED